MGGVEVAAPAFHLHEQGAGPQRVDVALGAVGLFDAGFEAGAAVALGGKHVEEVAQEGLGLGFFVVVVGVLAHEIGGAVAQLGEGERHGGEGRVAV